MIHGAGIRCTEGNGGKEEGKKAYAALGLLLCVAHLRLAASVRAPKWVQLHLRTLETGFCGSRMVKVGVLRECVRTARIWTLIFLADCTFHGFL